MKNFLFSVFLSKFEKIFIIANNLEKNLSWIPGCENGMDRIVEFFQLTSKAEDELEKLIPMENVEFKDKKQQEFVVRFLKFIKNVGRNHNWNKTPKWEKINSSRIHIKLAFPTSEVFKTRSVSEHLARKNNPTTEVDRLPLGNHEKSRWNEKQLIEQFVVTPFMKESYENLQNILGDFKVN